MQYGMPGFECEGMVVAGFGAFSKQCGLYVSNAAKNAHAEEIAAAGLRASKTGITFSPGKPTPDEFITALAIASRGESTI